MGVKEGTNYSMTVYECHANNGYDNNTCWLYIKCFTTKHQHIHQCTSHLLVLVHSDYLVRLGSDGSLQWQCHCCPYTPCLIMVEHVVAYFNCAIH